MSANINVVNGVATMAYTGERPWHNLGQYVEGEAMTAEQALELGHLNYKVSKEPLTTTFNGEAIKIKHKVAVIRQDTMQSIGIVGPKYKLLQNVDAFSFFDAIVGKGEAIYHTVGALGDGEKIWLMAKLPKDINVKGDITESFLLLYNAHDGSSAVRAKFTPVRVVCQNTLNAALGKDGNKEINIRHTTNIETKLKTAHKLLDIAARTMDYTEKVYIKLAETKVSESEVKAFLDILIPEHADATFNTRRNNILVGIREKFVSGKGNNGETLWDLYNGVTEYVDFDRTVKKNTPRWIASTFGSGSKIKSDAFRLVSSLAKVA
jgi:phage/plasmid-like protein (TIGR03299 family)